MKIVCAPDSFKESIDAVSAAAAMARGVRDAIEGVVVDQCPLGDGGEGTLQALLVSLGGETVPCSVCGVHGSAVAARTGRFPDRNFAFVESAEAIGLQTVATEDRNILTASSFGVGEMMTAACEQGCDRLLVGLGGSATNDGGCGMAQALGVRFFDAAGRRIKDRLTGGSLQQVARVDLSGRSAAIGQTEIIALCDVTNPLTGATGAAAVFGPQKGASADDVKLLDAGLAHLADVVRRDLGIDVNEISGAGAAGGLGAGMLAFAGAKLVSGIDTVLDAVEFRSRVAGATLCLTGEGRLDGQSLSGKTCIGVARAAADCRVPVVALVGSAGPDADRCLEAGLTGYVVIGAGLDAAESIRRTESLLVEYAAAVARNYRPDDATITC